MLVVFDNEYEKEAFDHNLCNLVFSYDPFNCAKYVVASPGVPFKSVSIEVADYLVDLQQREEYK